MDIPPDVYQHIALMNNKYYFPMKNNVESPIRLFWTNYV